MNQGILSEIVTSYQEAAEPFAELLTPYLLALLAATFAVQAAWDLIVWGVQDKPLFAYALRKLLVFSVMFFLISNFQVWLPVVLGTFTFLGEKLTSLGGFSPEAVFRQGLALASLVYHSWGNVFTRMIPGLDGFAQTAFFLIAGAFGLVALQMVRVLVEAAIAVSGMAIFLGFAGLKATFSLAEGYLKYLVEIGVRFYVLYLLVAVGRNFAIVWMERLQEMTFYDPIAHFTALLASASFAFIVWVLPNRMATAVSSGFNLGGNPLADS
jgi:P-type conjugative transfer protein TrbL